jgi:hypothetical protein
MFSGLGCFLFGMFYSWDLSKLGSFCSWDVLELGRFIVGTFCFRTFCIWDVFRPGRLSWDIL